MNRTSNRIEKLRKSLKADRADAVLIASVTMLAAPLAEPARPARNRTPATTGAAVSVEMVTASGGGMDPRDHRLRQARQLEHHLRTGVEESALPVVVDMRAHFLQVVSRAEGG